MNINLQDIYNILKTFISIALKKPYRTMHNITAVHFITFRNFFPNGGTGGGAAVQSANKIIFGNRIDDIKLKYSFRDKHKNYNKDNDLWDIWEAIKFVKQNIKNDKNCAYITHDYGSATGLALLGKKYVLISHIQGSRVEEKTNFGEKFSTVSAKIIQVLEKFAFKNAQAVYFPSNGAYKYFCNSKYKIINDNEFKFGGVLYNTLYAHPDTESINNIIKNDSCITILSVGQLTAAKGIDKHSAFIDHLLKNTDKKIRYIFIGKGILKDEIVNKLNMLKQQYSNFDYIHIAKCTYPQMQYLQDISDIYLMLHRISVFDLTTLEVMNKSKCVILSDVGGNPEFNKEDNIIIVKDDDYDTAVKHLLSTNIKNLGQKNKMVYDKYFSNDVFKNNYKQVIYKLIGEIE